MSETPSLRGCFSKLTRAQEQLAMLGEELREYVEGKPYDLPNHVQQSASGWFVFRYSNVQSPDPDLRRGVILGEIIHDIRSSLDQLVWQLVQLDRGKPTSERQIQFPICDGERAPKVQVKGDLTHYWSVDSPKFLSGVSAPHVAMIQRLQPYNRGDRAEYHPLSVLNDLWNTDKHRIIHVMALNRPYGVVPRLGLDLQGFSGIRAELKIPPGPVENDAIALAFRVTAAPFGLPRHMQVRGEVPLQVLFGKRALRVYDLKRICLFVARSVFQRRFAPLFGETVPDHLLVHPRQPRGFGRIAPNEWGWGLQRPEDSPAVFDDWSVWFDAGEYWGAQPLWNFEGRNEKWRWLLDAREVSTVEAFRRATARFLPEDIFRRVEEHFRPVARETSVGFGVFPAEPE